MLSCAFFPLRIGLIDVAPFPILTGLKGADNWMLSRVEMGGGVLVFGAVAASNMTAGFAESEVDPAIPHFQAFLTAVCRGFDLFNLI